jgi:hypothetical protein
VAFGVRLAPFGDVVEGALVLDVAFARVTGASPTLCLAHAGGCHNGGDLELYEDDGDQFEAVPAIAVALPGKGFALLMLFEHGLMGGVLFLDVGLSAHENWRMRRLVRGEANS